MEGDGVRAVRLREYLAADSDNADLACELADELAAHGQIAQADAVLAGLSESVQVIDSIAFRRARLAIASGRYAQALEHLAGLVERGVQAPAVAHDIAFCQLCLRQPERARRTLEDALEHYGASVPLHILSARIALMEQQFPQALAALRSALNIDPEDSQAHGVNALALFDSSQFDQAAAAARTALQLEPEQHEALLVAGTLALWNRRWEEAEALLERALQRHANSGRALSGLGQCLMLRNDLARATDVLERATRAMPEHIGTWHALAWAQLLQGNADAAYNSYQQAYAVDRNFGDTHGGLALVAVLRGRDDEAKQSIERALRLDRNAVTARYARSLLLQNQGDAAASQAELSELLAAGGLPAVPVAEFAQRLRQTLTPS